MELEIVRLRREVADLIVELLPPHANQSKINGLVVASGFSRTLIEGVRGGGATTYVATIDIEKCVRTAGR